MEGLTPLNFKFRCDSCGKFVSIMDVWNEKAIRRLITPDSHYTKEEYETLCQACVEKEVNHEKQ